MFFPGVRRRVFHLPHAVVPFGLAVVAISVTLVGWAVFAPSGAGNTSVVAGTDITTIKSIAYTSPGIGADDLVVKPAAPGLAPQVMLPSRTTH